MEQNLDNKIDIKERIINFYKKNKIKIYIFIIGIIILIISISLLEINKQKKNNLISEQYTNAGIFYAENKKDESKRIYEKILKSKNSFYSNLALINLLEKNLEDNSSKILQYFAIVEKLQKNKEQLDILKLKKALYLLQIQKANEAKILLNELIDSNSKIKKLAEKILIN